MEKERVGYKRGCCCMWVFILFDSLCPSCCITVVQCIGTEALGPLRRYMKLIVEIRARREPDAQSTPLYGALPKAVFESGRD